MSSRKLIGDNSNNQISPNSRKTCRIARITVRDRKHISPQHKKCSTLPCTCKNNKEVCISGKTDSSKSSKFETFSEYFRQKMTGNERTIKTHVFLDDETKNQIESVISPISTLTTWGSCNSIMKNLKTPEDGAKENPPVLKIIRRSQSVPAPVERMNLPSSVNSDNEGRNSLYNQKDDQIRKRSSSFSRRKSSPNRKPFLPSVYHQSSLGQLTWRQKSPEKLLFRAEKFSDHPDEDEEKSLTYPHDELSSKNLKSTPKAWTGPRLSKINFKEINVSNAPIDKRFDMELVINPDRIATFEVIRSNKRDIAVPITPLQTWRPDTIRPTFPLMI